MEGTEETAEEFGGNIDAEPLSLHLHGIEIPAFVEIWPQPPQ
jgi:hypothetical protein